LNLDQQEETRTIQTAKKVDRTIPIMDDILRKGVKKQYEFTMLWHNFTAWDSWGVSLIEINSHNEPFEFWSFPERFDLMKALNEGFISTL
jgi:hypothetical protein